MMNGIKGIINTIYNTAKTTSSTPNEAKKLQRETERLVDTLAEYIQLLLRLEGVTKFKDATVKFLISLIFIVYLSSISFGGLPSDFLSYTLRSSFLKSITDY